ncbi:MAG: RpiB/LacA/LacB family sugar-phosphate isomerase [Bacilli bacterium]
MATIRIHICLIILVIFNSCERNSEVIKRKELGIYCCASGIGVSMVANRNREIRAVNACIKEHALFARLHEEANVLCLGQKYVDFDFAIEALKIFMTTKFDGGRHLRRINKY